MTRCSGIKNSVCESGPVSISRASNIEKIVDENNASNRFTFVDLREGLWSLQQVEIYKENPIIECPLGGSVVFYYPNYKHDVVAMADKEHYENCIFENSIVLAPFSVSEDHDSVTYYHHCTTPGQIDYISCSVPGHCDFGQKIKIRTSSTVKARDEVTGEWLIHSSSLERVMRLMGRNFDNPYRFLTLDRGYQTESLANETLELIWCGLDHCPSFDDISPDSSLSDCEGAVYTLMGFVSRTRPIPQYEEAESYYELAIESGGVNECAARSYLTKLHLSKEAYENATKAANGLCEVCGNKNDGFGASIRQAKYEFDLLSNTTNVSWPTEGSCASLHPSVFEITSSSSYVSFHQIFFILTTLLTLFLTTGKTR